MNVEYGSACATSASGAHNLGCGVRGVRKSGVRISPLPPRRDRFRVGGRVAAAATGRVSVAAAPDGGRVLGSVAVAASVAPWMRVVIPRQ